jgi:hypothetical protein
MEPNDLDGFMSIATFMPLVILSIPFAIGNWYLAKSMNRSEPAWVILSLIPILNIFFFYYIGYVVVLYIIRRLNALSSALHTTELPLRRNARDTQGAEAR